jgi:site-specific recombinase XerD
MSLPQRLPDEDRTIVTDFDRHLAANQLSAGHRANYLTRLTKIREMVGKSLREASKNDLEKVLADLGNRQLSSRTIQGYKITLKSFYKWLLGNNEEYPDNVRWIKTTLKNGRKLPRDSLLTNEEIEKLIQVCYTDRDRAMVLILAESGVWSGELLSLRVRDVRFDQYGAIINVTGKTGDRSVRLIASAPALATWFEHHPTRDNPTAPLWVDLKTNKLGEGMTYQGLRSVILRLKNRAGIKKRIHLHGFRHTAATRLARLLTKAEMKSYLGWVQGSQMASVYIHLSSKDVDRSLLRIHGLITEDEDRERKFTAIKCPRCTHANNPGTKLCEKCGLPLTFEAVKEIDAKLVFKRALLEKVMQMPEFEKIKDLIEALGEKVLAEEEA